MGNPGFDLNQDRQIVQFKNVPAGRVIPTNVANRGGAKVSGPCTPRSPGLVTGTTIEGGALGCRPSLRRFVEAASRQLRAALQVTHNFAGSRIDEMHS
jgi:hypothetical protein